MSCQRLTRSAKPASWLHRLRCAECRAARAADAVLHLGIECLKAGAAPAEGLARTLRALGTVAAPSQRRRAARWAALRWFAARAGLAAAFPILFGMVWLHRNYTDPNIPIPPRALPSPNAFDYFQAACLPLKDDQQISKALDSKLAASDLAIPANAGTPPSPQAGTAAQAGVPAPAVQASAPVQATAAAGMPVAGHATAGSGMGMMGQATVTGPVPATTAKPASQGHDFEVTQYLGKPNLARPAPNVQKGYPADVLAYKEALVHKYAASLHKLREGFAYPYVEPRMESLSRSSDIPYPDYEAYRNMARLLALEEQTRAAHGDWAGAVNSGLDAIEMGILIPQGAELYGRLVGIACEATGRKPLWSMVDHLTAAQARAAARRLERLTALRQPMAATLEAEKWAKVAWLQELFRKPGWLRGFIDGEQNAGQDLMMHLALLRYSKREILDNYKRYMDQVIKEARLPYAPHPPEIPLPPDPINQTLGPVFTHDPMQDLAGSQCADAMLMVSLALHAYRLEHGSYPETLQELAPIAGPGIRGRPYLQCVPADPFAQADTPMIGVSGMRPSSTDPFKYRRTDTKYVLYSVGPDSRDDGGVPIEDTNRGIGESRYWVQADSVGDIVAGVNVK